MRYVLAALLLYANLVAVNAQDEPSKNIKASTGFDFFYGGIETSTVSYINTDSRDSNGRAVYLSPYLDYNHKSGLGLRVQSYMLPGGSNPGFYLTSVSPYFARYEGKLLPYISYTRFIRHDNPSVFYSPIENEIYAHLRIKTRYVQPLAGIDIGFGNDEENNDEVVTDVNAFIGVMHLYVKDSLGRRGNNAFALRPALQLNAGTDRYYKFLRTSGYISRNTKANRIGYGRHRGDGGPGGGTSGAVDIYTISPENEFSLSNVEANIALMYFLGRFSIDASGSLYFPLRGEDRTPYGFWQLNLSYWIN